MSKKALAAVGEAASFPYSNSRFLRRPLSKIERGEQPPPGEQTIRRLAEELGENPDALLALAGKVSSDLLEIIRERPTVVAELLRALRGLSAKRVSAISRQIRDGDW